jgi:hypothetical protein
MRGSEEVSRKTKPVQNIELIVRADPRLGRAFEAMCGRGLSKLDAEGEIGMALFSFMHDVANGHPSRLSYVMKMLDEGKTMNAIFPEGAFQGDFPGVPPFRVKDNDGVIMTEKEEEETKSGPLSVGTVKKLLRRSENEGTEIFELLRQFIKAQEAPRQ